MDIADWLRDLGLERYAQAFRDSEIDAVVLPELTDADLKGLGIPLGSRKKLLKAVAALAAGDKRSPVPQAETSAAPEARPAGAERRQLTVMFADLVGSTTLARQLDPEDMSEVMRAYHGRTTEVIRRWGGHVAKYLGDGVLPYLGGRRPMRMTPSGRSAPVWNSPRLSAGLPRATARAWRRGSGSRPDGWW